MREWSELLNRLEAEIGQDAVSRWLRPIKIARFDAANLYLEADSFQTHWFQEQILPSHLRF